MLKIISLFLLTLFFNGFMLIGAGGFDIEKKGDLFGFRNDKNNSKHAYITDAIEKYSPNVNSVVLWITRDWQSDWYSVDEVQKEVVQRGYTPVFVFYYFGDDISKEFIKTHREDYFRQLKTFVKYMKKIDSQKVVVLNPEYNMFGCEKLDEMNDIFLQSYEIVRGDVQAVVGPCVGDFGDYGYTDEPKEWRLFAPSLDRAAKQADFIAFQEMRGLGRNSKSDILNTPKRAYNFSKYLYKTYKKPTVLAYLAISTYGKDGKNIQAKVYKDFLYYIPKMQKEAHLILFATFHYFDYPGHVGYFNKGEEHFGLVTKDGRKKPALEFFRAIQPFVKTRQKR